MKSNFFKSPLGIAIMIAGAAVVVLGAIILSDLFVGDTISNKKIKEMQGREWRNVEQRDIGSTTTNYGLKEGEFEKEQKPEPEEKNAQELAPQAQNNNPPARPPERRDNRVFPGITVYSEVREPSFEQQQLKLSRKNMVPFGRMIRCRLVNAVDSSNLQTPVIGLVEEDLIWDGKIIIPKNSEVHGMAQGANATRDRIGCAQEWKIVLKENKFKNRRELDLKGLALDAGYDPETDTYSITDGSAGLRGQIIDNTEGKEFKLFMAAFLSGMSSAFRDTTTSEFGTVQVMPNARNAALGGVGEVMNEYVRMIREAIRRDGVFIRCYGDKQFYLYVQQSIDLQRAKINAAPEMPIKK